MGKVCWRALDWEWGRVVGLVCIVSSLSGQLSLISHVRVCFLLSLLPLFCIIEFSGESAGGTLGHL
jgi:hypothetical protein